MHKWVFGVSHSFQITCACRSDVKLHVAVRQGESDIPSIDLLVSHMSDVYHRSTDVHAAAYGRQTSYILIHLPRFLSDVYASLVYLRSCIWIVSNFLISCVSCACDVYILDVHTRQIIPQTTDVALSHVSHLQRGGRPLWKTICSALSRLVTCNYIYRRNMCMSMYICILHVFSIWQLYIYIYMKNI